MYTGHVLVDDDSSFLSWMRCAQFATDDSQVTERSPLRIHLVVPD